MPRWYVQLRIDRHEGGQSVTWVGFESPSLEAAQGEVREIREKVKRLPDVKEITEKIELTTHFPHGNPMIVSLEEFVSHNTPKLAEVA